MASSPILVTDDPQFLTGRDDVYTAADLRRLVAPVMRPGVSGGASFVVQPDGVGLAVTVGTDDLPSTAIVKGTSVDDQGYYRVHAEAGAYTLDIPENTSGLPVVHAVVLRVEDQEHAGSNNRAVIELVEGTATSGATLSNLDGAGTLPASCLYLADILVASGEDVLEASMIRDRRVFQGSVAPSTFASYGDAVTLRPVPGATTTEFGSLSHANNDLEAGYALFELDRPIKGVTKLRWKYAHDTTTALAGSYSLAIFDVSGRLVVASTGNTFSGAAGTVQLPACTITETDFDPGLYFVRVALDSSAGAIRFQGVTGDLIASSLGRAPTAPGVVLGESSASTTPPNDMRDVTTVDSFGSTSSLTYPSVPLLTLTQS